MLVLTWTGTFLHDLDELCHFPSLVAMDESAHHDAYAGNFHHHHHDTDSSIALPEGHGHDPSALGTHRNAQTITLEVSPALVSFLTMDWAPTSEAAICHACYERPPPYRCTPSYLLYHAMLI
jgi:hypothetical protein